MCILAFAATAKGGFALVHVRDEDVLRQTLPLERQEDGVIMARDGLSGGTWMGYNVNTGVFAALTNVRQVASCRAVEPSSRGVLVTKLLRDSFDGMLHPHSALNGQYEGFNLVSGCLAMGQPLVQLVSNRAAASASGQPDATDRLVTAMPAAQQGVTCFSNGRLGASWAKISNLQRRVQALLDAAGPDADDAESLSAALVAEAMSRVDLDGELAAESSPSGDIESSNVDSVWERSMRRHVFLLHGDAAEPRTASVSVSVIVALGDVVHYRYYDVLASSTAMHTVPRPVRAPVVSLGPSPAVASLAPALFGACIRVAPVVSLRFDPRAAVLSILPDDAASDGAATLRGLPMGHFAAESIRDGPLRCPLAEVAASPALLTEWGVRPRSWAVRVAVVVLAFTSDGALLITQRSARGTFPSLWVCPGGHVDPADASLEAAAVRELAEECGIVVAPSVLKPLCVWETFTDPGERETPRQYAMTCFVAQLEGDAAAVAAALAPDPTEVSKWALMPESWQRQVVIGGQGFDASLAGSGWDGARWAPETVRVTDRGGSNEFAEGHRFAVGVYHHQRHARV